MGRQAPQRRTSTAAAVLVGVLLLVVPTTAGAAHAGDRPPAHARSGEAPPEHAHSAAPEDRPPAHARARRASTRPDTASTRHGARSPASPRSPGPSGGPRPAAPPAAAPAAPRGEGPPAGAPAHGRSDDDPDTTAGTDPGTELDTDRVVDGPAPTADRAPATAGGPVLSTSPPLAVLASSLLGGSPGGPLSSVGTPSPEGTVAGTDGAGGDGDVDGDVDGDQGSVRDPLAAPRTRSVPPMFGAPELARRVVVPVVVLVAALVYLLAQGRIDRRGVLLLAPIEPGTEGDDEVFEL